ncbi:MAG: ABC transporter permease, partial [Emergencia sp.]
MSSLREIISTQIRYRRQIFKLAKSDIIKTYSGTMLGWSWALIKPAIYISIYYVAFTWGLRVGQPIGEYSYFMWIISGLIPWFYIRDVFTGGAGSIRKYRYLVTKIKFPISVIPTIESVSLLMVNGVLILILLLYFILAGKGPDLYWLQLPLYIGFMFLFFTSWSLFSGILSTMSKDFLQLIKSVTIALFWLSGIIFDMSGVANPILRVVLLINPITMVVNGFRNSLIYKQWFWEEWQALVAFAIVYA